MFINPQVQIVANVLKNNGVCILPTETIYGLATLCSNAVGIEKIFKLKQRSSLKPLAKIFPSTGYALDFISNHNDKKVRNFLQLYNRKQITELINTGSTLILPSSVGFRVTHHKFLQGIILTLEEALFVTSVNISNKEPAIKFCDIEPGVINGADLSINLDNTVTGVPSTIIDFRDKNTAITRVGFTSMLQLELILGHKLKTI
ncbi:MAG: Sua5/YciO/YrdC/YwlC family protein [Alphaproteobacteria bacterium]|nr:Sua5/YciO/YrdC/YwlC family protein [Rickettsiales bacterium]